MTSRTWIKIFCDKWLEGSIRQDTPEIRGTWIDVLALAGSGKYGDIGEIKVTSRIGLSDEQIAGIFNISAELWIKIKNRLIETKRIAVSPTNVITISNWAKYQSEYNRQKRYRKAATKSYNPRLQAEVTDENKKEKKKKREKEEKECRSLELTVLPDWINRPPGSVCGNEKNHQRAFNRICQNSGYKQAGKI
jgi:hypothetical protein